VDKSSYLCHISIHHLISRQLLEQPSKYNTPATFRNFLGSQCYAIAIFHCHPSSERMSINEQIKSMYLSIVGKAYSEATFTTVYRDVSYQQLATTLGISCSILILIWLVFEYLAKRDGTKYLYRQRLCHPRCIEATISGQDSRLPPPDSTWMGSVILGTMCIQEAELSRLMGIGGYLSYRIMRHCLYFSVIAIVYGGLVLLPVYISQHGHSARDKTFLGMIVANNISDNNPSHTWVLVISSYLLCAYWCVVLHFEWQIVKQMQLSFEHDNRTANKQVYYSVMVEGTAKSDIGSIRNGLPKLIGRDSEEVHSIVVVPKAEDLRAIQRKLYWYRLIPSFMFFNASKEETISALSMERLRVIERMREISESGPDAVHSLRLQKRASTMSDLHQIENTSPEKSIGITTMRTTSSLFSNVSLLFVTRRVHVYFVTMWSSSAKILLALIYNREVINSELDSAAINRIASAPPPSDIIWKNISVSTRVLRNREFFVRALLVLVAVGYSYPISRLQDCAKIDSKDISPEDKQFGTKAWFKQMLSVYVPAIIQLVLTQLIPVVLRLVSLNYERRKTYQDVSKFVLHRAFLFQLLTVYVIVFGDLWGDLSKLSGGVMYFYNSMVMRLRRLGNEIPPVGHYFASTITVAILTEVGVQMLNPLQLLHYSVSSKVEAHKTKLIQYKYSSSYSFILTLVNIMFTFCLITPVVMAISCIFWGINQVWTKYALIYLNNRRYEIGTAFSPVIFSAFATSLLISQIAVFVVLLSMDAGKWDNHINAQVITTGVLVVMVVVYKYIVMRNFVLHEHQSYQTSQLLESDTKESRERLASSFTKSYYIQPELKDSSDSVGGSKFGETPPEEEKLGLVANKENP